MVAGTNCTDDSQCNWPLGECIDPPASHGGPSSCWCIPGVYTIYSAGADCHWARSASSLSMQILFILVTLAFLIATVYKLVVIRRTISSFSSSSSSSSPSSSSASLLSSSFLPPSPPSCLSPVVAFFSLPTSLCLLWLLYLLSLLAVLFCLIFQLSGYPLVVVTQFSSVVASTAVLGPLLYSHWFAMFSFQMVTRIPAVLRARLRLLNYLLIGLLTLGVFATNTLFAVLGGDLLHGLLYAFLGAAIGYISVCLIASPVAVFFRYYDNPPALILRLRYAWVLHAVLGLASLLAMCETIFVAVWRLTGLAMHTIFDSYKETRIILDLNFFYLAFWYFAFCFVVLITLNHTQPNANSSKSIGLIPSSELSGHNIYQAILDDTTRLNSSDDELL